MRSIHALGLPVFSVALLASVTSSAAEPPKSGQAEAGATADAPPKKTTLDAAPSFALPVGNFSDVTGIGLGVLLGLRHPIANQLDVTGRAGFVYHFSKSDPTGTVSMGTSELPLLGGVRYTFVPSTDGGFYGGAELGLSVVFLRASVGGIRGVGTVSGSDTSVKASTALGLGYQLGKLDIKGSLYFVDIGHLGDTMALMASAGYSFADF